MLKLRKKNSSKQIEVLLNSSFGMAGHCSFPHFFRLNCERVCDELKGSLHTHYYFRPKNQTLDIHWIFKMIHDSNSKISQYSLKVYCSITFTWVATHFVLFADLHCRSENYLVELYKQYYLNILLNSIQDWVTSEVNLHVWSLWSLSHLVFSMSTKCLLFFINSISEIKPKYYVNG